VAIDFSLLVTEQPFPELKFFGPIMYIAYEDALLEFTGEVRYTPEFDRLA
jgi:hypothetical protein